MIIQKRVAAKIPTVQYGNVDLEIAINHEFTPPADPAKLKQAVSYYGSFIDKMVKQEYTKFHDEMAKAVTELTTLE